MYALLLIAAIALFTIRYQPKETDIADSIPAKVSTKLDRLWQIAQQSLREQKYLRAEKALLTILHTDERNATAYNRLGILYAKQQAYKDAIECFEIAQSLEPSASSLHNVGLIYYETGHYENAELAFRQALAIDDTLAARYIAYAKVQEKMGHTKQMIESVEKAVEIEPSPQSYNILADTYERAGFPEEAKKARSKVTRLLKKAEKRPRSLLQIRKVS